MVFFTTASFKIIGESNFHLSFFFLKQKIFYYKILKLSEVFVHFCAHRVMGFLSILLQRCCKNFYCPVISYINPVDIFFQYLSFYVI